MKARAHPSDGSTLRHVVAAVILAAASLAAPAQDGKLAPNAPKDRPAVAESIEEGHAAIAPYVARARATYPAAKARYLSGLPKGQSFFVTVPLHDDRGMEEDVFVLVRHVADGQVTGQIANAVERVRGYRQSQSITFPEPELIDWLITKPDGSEEGNLVGKYLDAHGGF